MGKVFKDGLRDSRDFEFEALAMVKLVKVIRQEIFEWDPAFHFHPTVRKIQYPPVY